MSERKHFMEEKLKDPQFADFVEETATQVVGCFRQFMDILRSEFPPIDSLKALKSPVTVRDKPLYTLIVNQGLLKLVEGAVRQAKSLDPEGDEAPPIIEDPTDFTSDERYNLVKEIIIPIVEALTWCYRIIDQLPQPNPPQQHSPRSRNKKPAPPRGMLSIQNYTDVACVLEFLICASVMPHLDPFVVTPLQDRIRLLPKSIAGRLPRASLGWAASQPVQRTSLELQQTTHVVARLIFLDRFQPMLLPRHVTDLYAAIFQAEQLETDSIARSLGYQLLYDKLGLATSSSAIIDPHLQAKAYQLLLLQGTRGPKWLRQRVSPLLTALACRDLSAILHVFVPIKEPSMAAQRLGKALSPAASGTQAREFCQQLLQVLQEAYPLADQHHPRQVAMSLTIWAALYQLPPPTLKLQILPLWAHGFHTSERIHPSIRQVGSLASWIPPSTNPGTVLQWLLLSPLSSAPTTDTTTDPGTHSTILGQLLRIAAMPSVLASKAKQDALMTLQWSSKALCASTVESKQSMDRDRLPPVEGASILSLALVYAMAPSSWDLKGNRYSSGRSGPQEEADLEEVTIEEDQGNSPDVTLIAEDITKRANLLVDEILLVFEEASAAAAAEEKSKDQEKDMTRGLPSRLFRLLLCIYLSTTTSSAPSSIMPEALHSHADSIRLVSMILLPLICEKCSPESLLLGDQKDATGVLSMVKLVLVCAKSRLEDSSGKTNETVEETGIASEIQREDNDSKQCNLIFQQILQDDASMKVETSAPERGADHEENDDTLLSIASIVLSLLIAVLELGSTKRSSQEEEMLVSFHPILKPLVELNVSPSTSETSSAWSEAGAGMADMASYAMALIASRNAAENVFDEQKADDRLVSSQEKMSNMIAQAEQDLQSTQPPLRARGMVSLGRLARGYLGGIQEQEEVAKPLVIELDQSGTSKEDPAQSLIREILRLSIIALSDPESYVYLAAVQTIVAAGDMRPKQVLPVIASAVATGVVHQNSTELATTTTTTLSMEQRIKLAEALMFIIRRRAASYEFIPMLVNVMVFGSPDEPIGNSDDKIHGGENGKRMQQETHNYFTRGFLLDDDDNQKDKEMCQDEQTLQEQWQEQDVRSKTGGPLFAMEEADVVRAARISVLTELVTMSQPSFMAPYCDLLILLVTNVLRLESSRPVTRAASLLAKELYGAILREQELMTRGMIEDNNMTGRRSTTVSIPMTIAMVSSSKEELLCTTLQQEVSASGLTTSSIRNDVRMYDPATRARCTQALDLREQAEQGGIFAAAKLFLFQRQEMDASPRILQMVPPAHDEETESPVIVDKWNAVS